MSRRFPVSLISLLPRASPTSRLPLWPPGGLPALLLQMAGKVLVHLEKETERQKLLIKRASLARSRLLFVSNALKRLLTDDHFMALLRAEGLDTLPRALAERMSLEGQK
jgi:hypothetical protein